MSVYHHALLTTAALLLALMLLGLRLQWRERWPAASPDRLPRWPHHALFFVVCAGLVLSLWLGWRASARWWSLGPALACLLLMPRTRPGRSDHWRLALVAALTFFVGLWWAW